MSPPQILTIKIINDPPKFSTTQSGLLGTIIVGKLSSQKITFPLDPEGRVPLIINAINLPVFCKYTSSTGIIEISPTFNLITSNY